MTGSYRAMAVLAIILATASSALSQPATRDDAARLEFFEKKVRPVLVEHCHHCHSADTKPSGGLRVDDRNGLIIGGNSGAAIVPGDPDKSPLLNRVTVKDNKKLMPAEGKPLTEQQVADLRTWIKDGAAWPKPQVPASIGKPNPEYAKLKKEHWAWQPIKDPKVPAIQNAAWPKDDIDRFLLAGLEAKGLSPVADADREALLRRVTVDLTGLPPTPAEIDAFNTAYQADARKAFIEVVDRLLASPRFGEQWGRHWLDVARYGESTGPSRNIPYPHAWKYRNYVIDSINADVPFDRFIQEQIAGDLLPAESGVERDRLATATGFLAIGVKDVNQRFKVRFVMDNVDEQIDAVSRSVLGLTVTCARCHDHKFDPISTTEYYGLAGIFTSTDNCAGLRNKMGGGGLDYYDPAMLVTMTSNIPPVPTDQVEELKAEVAEAKKAWDAIRGTPEGLKTAANGQPTQRPFRLKYETLQGELTALTDPAARGYAVHGVRDAKVVGDTEIRLRGEAEQLGPLAQRGFLSVVNVPDARPINPKQSGRLELAQWLTSTKNPLTQRVIVNRIWAHLFGRGLVSTVDNFGANGARPSHLELLDHLANRFVREGSSFKKLVRTLVLTRAYQLSSQNSEANRKVDPANALVWRHSARRLTAEEFRDATLAAAGSLSLKRPESSPAKTLKMVEMQDNGPEAKTIHESADRSRVRSIYLPLLRGVTPHALEAFDPVEQTLVTGSRDATTVPGQALFLLNSTFVRRQALTLAERVLKDARVSDAERIQQMYRLALGRSPSETEVTRAIAFLGDYESAAREEFAKPKPVVKKEQPKAQPKKETPANPDEIDQTGEAIVAEVVEPKDAKSAAWQSLMQALYGSVEFRFVR